jgi:hypothetical protein
VAQQSAHEDAPPRPSFARGSDTIPLILLVALFVLSAVVYTLLAHQSPIPLLLPDEGVYMQLAQSVAAGDGFEIRGIPVDLNSPLYVYLIAPAWKWASGSDAFADAQTIGAVLLSLTVFPVWLLARRYVGGWVALVPAVLVLSGSWMLTAAGLLTENAGLPLSAAALAATVVALSNPSSRKGTIWGLVAIAFALLAAFARVQLAVLFPVIVLAVAADCARYWSDWRERLMAHRVLAAVSVAITAIGAIAVIASPSGTLGIYERFQGGGAMDDLSNALKDQFTGLLAMSAVLPLVIVAAACARIEAWRDERLGPLLAVTSATVLLFLFQAAWALTTFLEDGLTPWHIQRYTEYALPLLLVTMTVLIVWRRVPARELAIAAGVAVLILLATPGVRDVQEERGLFGIQERVNSVLGTSAGVSLGLVALLLGGIALLAVWRLRERPVAALLVVGLSVFAVFLVQQQVLWPWQKKATNAFRAGLPSSLSWVDDLKPGPVARMLVIDNPNRAEMTQFFNEDIDRTYIPAQGQYFGRRVNGLQCDWSVNTAGVVEWGTVCGPAPTRLLLDNDYSKLTFDDQRVLAQKPGVGRLVAIDATPSSPARLKAVMRVPCQPPIPETEKGGHGRQKPLDPACFNQLGGAFWLQEPGQLVLTFRGGSRPQTLAFADGSRTVTIKPGTETVVRAPLARGSSQFGAQLDWQKAGPGYPELTSAQLVEGDGTRTELLY